ncbi:MAG: tRNA adenosine(34) deaminase TadA [Clostridia bacterium]|nr:tRNA adenosine(34) deaminase TadA [Clostridia bacterium]
MQARKRNSDYYMQAALNEAQLAFAMDEVPVGAVIEYKGEIIAAAHNLVESTQDAMAHAEILAMREASRRMESWRLQDCTLYVTLEPCAMCAGAAVNCRLKRIVFGAFDEKYGACGSAIDLTDGLLANRIEVIGSVMEAECSKLLSEYFKKKRGK